jgi:hypothetical protein
VTEPTRCDRCEGCGQIADDEDGTPWHAWAALPPVARLAVTLGHVKPLPCPQCDGHGVVPPPSASLYGEHFTPEGVTTTLEAAVAKISDTLDAIYAANGVAPEAVLWRRVTKCVEEAGEVHTALAAYVGENPRKSMGPKSDVLHELHDTALAALGAIYHLTGKPVGPSLAVHAHAVAVRLERAVEDQ